MRIDEAVLKKLPLSDALADVTSGHLDRFPPLIMDACLAGAAEKVVPALVARFSGGTVVHSETLTMPRKGFSPRPVTMTDTATRAVYTALVRSLEAELPPARDGDDWQRHEQFGAVDDPWDPDYLVEFDIASCYEYIEHERLREELLLRTADLRHVEPCLALLRELFPKGRGLPQLSKASDALADAYLEILERAILRTGASVSRFADDFKAQRPSWESATGLIEVAAEEARGLGWILAADKTHVWKRETLVTRRTEENRFLSTYFSKAQQALTTIDFLMGGGYGVDVVTVEPDQEETVREALRRIMHDWYAKETGDGTAAGQTMHGQYLAAALALLTAAPDRVPDEWLLELAFRQPIRLEGVCNYMTRRDEPQANWRTLTALAAMQRQSPWWKLWLLYVGVTLPRMDGHSDKIDEWAEQQLSDRHETVRAQAAWYVSLSSKTIDEGRLAQLYSLASTLTRPAIAAACGALNLPATSGLVKALKQDGRLMAVGYAYGTSVDATA